MNVEHQVLEVGVHTRLRINGRLFVRKQVIELDDSNRDCLKLLRFQHDLL